MKRKILSSDYYKLNQANGIAEIHINSLPTLYKYQKVSDYSLANLDNNEIWGTRPDAFNDPYDCICCHSHSEIIKAINEQLSTERLNKYKTLFQGKKRSDIINELASSLLINHNENFRKQYCVSCFSIYNDSEIMWGHYADCAKGFVAAYDGSDLMKCALISNKATLETIKTLNMFDWDYSGVQEDNLTTIMPIIYSNGKVNITENLVQSLPFILEYYDDICNGATVIAAINKYHNKSRIDIYKDLRSNNLFYSIMCNKSKC